MSKLRLSAACQRTLPRCKLLKWYNTSIQADQHHARHLAAVKKPDSSYTGVRIQKDKSLLSFGLTLFRPRTNDNTAPRPTARHLFIYFCPCATPGAKQDVQLARTGPGQLTFFGDSLNVGRGIGAFPSLALLIAYIVGL